MSVVPTTTAPQRRRPERPLTQDVILDGAVALIEREGPAGLSMRRLGADLGVEGMAIYHHFENRDALLSAIGDRLLEPMDRLELGDDWREACRVFATALRDIAVARPATFQLLGLKPLDTTSSLRSVERLMGMLVERGFAPAIALAIYRATVSYARGYALAEATGFTVDAAQRAGRRRLAALPGDEFPILRGRAEALAELDADTGYALGLRALLAGFPEPGATGRAAPKPKRTKRRQ